MKNLENKICEYGCGQEAKFYFKTANKWCCSKNYQQCPIERKEKSKTNKGKNNPMYKKVAWNKGLTKDIDDRVKKNAENIKKTKNRRKYIPWNKGLTKETDRRISLYAKKVSNTKKGKPNYKKRKTITTNGITPAQFRYLIKRRLYMEWVNPILERDKFKCRNCGTHNNLEVHHIKSYYKIFVEALNICKLDIKEYNNWSQNDIQKLEDKIIDLHDLELGITLCTKCHGEADEKRKRFFKTGMSNKR